MLHALRLPTRHPRSAPRQGLEIDLRLVKNVMNGGKNGGLMILMVVIRMMGWPKIDDQYGGLMVVKIVA